MRHSSRTRLALICSIFAAVAVTCGLGAGSALAAGAVSLTTDKTQLTFTGGGTDPSTLTLKYSAFTYVLEETTVPLTAGSGCTQVSTRKVSCPSIDVVDVQLNMGAGCDKLTIGAAGLIPTYVLTTVNDVGPVTGGDGPMVINSNDVACYGTVFGGSSYDTILLKDRISSIDGGGKDDVITVENNFTSPANVETSMSLSGGTGDDLIDASNSTAKMMYNASGGIDVVWLGPSSDEAVAGDGQDLIYGGGGNDRFYDGAGLSTTEFWGGPGNDTFTDMYPTKFEVTHFEGGPGIDRVTYRNQSDWKNDVHITLDPEINDGAILGLGQYEGDHFHESVENIGAYEELQSASQMAGDDELTGSARANEIHGEGGNDIIDGAAGNDNLFGGEGDDQIYGGDGNDILNGEFGADVLFGGAGNDRFKGAGAAQGDDGNDVFEGFSGNADGGNGDDTITFAGMSAATLDLGAEGINVSSIEKLIGSSNGDTFSGSDAAEIIDGADGNDSIETIDGGADTITCGGGTDTIDRDASDILTDPGNCENVTVH